MPRPGALGQILRLDPERDHQRICYLSACVEFPWDTTRSLELALFRTYCVPRMTEILVSTGEFARHAQKRYDDTVLILDAVLEHGTASDQGRAAIRRMNEMHRAHGVGNDDLRYVLATFVVMPIRWIDDFGWRRMTETERVASANYYRHLGRRMGIRDIPETWQAFARLLDAYERAHFDFDPGAREVAESTLALLATFPPNHRLPAALVRRISLAVMDAPLLDAFGFPRPGRPMRTLVRTGLRARGRFVRLLPPRREPYFARQLPQIRTYPDGYRVSELGTFPPAHPVPHPREETVESPERAG